MNCNFSHDCCVTTRFWTRLRINRALLAMAGVCLLVPTSGGCRTCCPEQTVAHHPSYAQLEQGCFGYEPTVWRNMAGDCQQAVRMIPDEVVNIPPKPAKEPTEAAKPIPSEEPAADNVIDQDLLNEVPESTPRSTIPRFALPPADDAESQPAPEPSDAADSMEVPPADTPAAQPPAVQPGAIPPAAEPATEPTAEPATEPAAEPTEPPAAEPSEPEAETPGSSSPPVSRTNTLSLPVLSGPEPSSPSLSARRLFDTISEALDEPAQHTTAARSTNKPVKANLAKFISY